MKALLLVGLVFTLFSSCSTDKGKRDVSRTVTLENTSATEFSVDVVAEQSDYLQYCFPARTAKTITIPAGESQTVTFDFVCTGEDITLNTLSYEERDFAIATLSSEYMADMTSASLTLRSSLEDAEESREVLTATIPITQTLNARDLQTSDDGQTENPVYRLDALSDVGALMVTSGDAEATSTYVALRAGAEFKDFEKVYVGIEADEIDSSLLAQAAKDLTLVGSKYFQAVSVDPGIVLGSMALEMNENLGSVKLACDSSGCAREQATE